MTESKGLKRGREIRGVIYVTLALFFLLCLFSYSPLDPSYTHYVPDKVKVNNLIGLFGSYTADSLIRLFGGSIFLLPLFLSIAGFRYLADECFRIRTLHLLGFAGLVLSLSILLGMTLRNPSLSGVTLRPGGLLGFFTFGFLNARLNNAGTALVTVSVFLISLTVMSNFSVVFTAKILSRITLFSWLRTHGLFASLWDRLKIRKLTGGKDKGRAPSKTCPLSFPGKRRKKPSRCPLISS
jgi:S-DNA-T family DNA segregation ATPase FtsK/SpoIIIE